MEKAGRPAKEFDHELFEQLCGIMCTEEEICDIFKTTDKTLSNWCKRTYKLNFSEAHKRFSSRGKLSLRRYQFKLAQRNASMAIFLGKNYLGQGDNGAVPVPGMDQPDDPLTASLREEAERMNNVE